MSQPLPLATILPDVETWLCGLGFPPREIKPLSGDVSPRRYARIALADGSTAILATYPPEIRSICPLYLRTGEILTEAGVRVPRVFGTSCEQGWMLLEDLGPRTVGEQGDRPWSELRLYFESACALIGRIAALPPEHVAEIAVLNPLLGSELLRQELAQTWDLFLEPRGLTGGESLTAALRTALDTLCERLGDETPVPCHRDFMVRNLMPLDDAGGIAVLDHQDMRLGPPEYDLASLLNDTLFPPPALEAELLGGVDRVRYHRAAAQRTLKAIGTYTKFSLRGAHRHLPLIPPTLARCLDHFARTPEGAPLADDLASVWEQVLS
jgi:aminoglycoside/choline kinase family phosphotransferase